MQKLELLEDIMPDELVRYYFPTADEDEVDWILFEKTSWPYGPIERINEGVYEWYLKSNASLR